MNLPGIHFGDDNKKTAAVLEMELQDELMNCKRDVCKWDECDPTSSDY